MSSKFLILDSRAASLRTRPVSSSPKTRRQTVFTGDSDVPELVKKCISSVHPIRLFAGSSFQLPRHLVNSERLEGPWGRLDAGRFPPG